MFAQVEQSQPTTTILSRWSLRVPGATAVALGAGFGLWLLLLLTGAMPFLAATGAGMLVSGLFLIGHVLWQNSAASSANWERAFLGQALGVVGIALLLITALI